MQKDYLKYWRVVRYFVKSKYNLSTSELEMLLFLHSEKYFGKDKFKEFDELLSWNINRFDQLLKKQWIEVFRKRTGRHKTLYSLSFKANKVIESVYKKLNGAPLPESPSANPLFKVNVSYTDKVYRNQIKEMNSFIRQQRHHSPEE
jgi:hypothetical protein